jgi:hypothetical protein
VTNATARAIREKVVRTIKITGGSVFLNDSHAAIETNEADRALVAIISPLIEPKDDEVSILSCRIRRSNIKMMVKIARPIKTGVPRSATSAM